MVRSSTKRRDISPSDTGSGTVEPDAGKAKPKKQPKSDTQPNGSRNVGPLAVLGKDILVELFHMNPDDIPPEGVVIETMLLKAFEQLGPLIKKLLPRDQEVFDHLQKSGKIEEAMDILRKRDTQRQAVQEVSPTTAASTDSLLADALEDPLTRSPVVLLSAGCGERQAPSRVRLAEKGARPPLAPRPVFQPMHGGTRATWFGAMT